MSYIGVQPTAGQYRQLDDISSGFNGSATSFTTSVGGTNVTATTAQQLLVSLGGVIQKPGSDYTTSTNSITFTTAPATGLSFFAVLMGDAVNVGTPADGSVTGVKLSTPFNYNSGLLYLDSINNRVGIGSTMPQNPLVVSNGGANGFEVSSATNSGTTSYLLSYNRSTSAYTDMRFDASAFRFEVSASEKARIDSSGRLLVGTSSTSSNTTALFQGYGGTPTGGAHLRLAAGTNAPASGANLGLVLFSDSEHTNCAFISADRDGGTWSASSKPTRLVFSTTADGASSPTERMRIASGGATTIGPSTTSFNSPGIAFNPETAGQAWFVRDSNYVLWVNRLTNDGDLVQFAQGSTIEGTISVSGTTVSYNGAHLSRWSQLSGGAEREEILRGTVLSNIDEMCEWGKEDNEQLNRMKVSDVEGDRNVAGVFQAWDDDDDTYTNDFYCAMTGDFIIRIAQGVKVERGDLLMSAGDGTAKPQDDDIIRSKTIAKVTSVHVTCTYDDGSYCVPCVLMAC